MSKQDEGLMSRLIAYVVLDADKPLDSTAVIAALRQRHPNQPVELMTGAAPPNVRAVASMTMMLRCAGVELIVMAMARPLPEEEWKLSALRAASLSPDRAPAFSGHKAHLVVTTLARRSPGVGAQHCGCRRGADRRLAGLPRGGVGEPGGALGGGVGGDQP
jgi:hypothetical protein